MQFKKKQIGKVLIEFMTRPAEKTKDLKNLQKNPKSVWTTLEIKMLKKRSQTIGETFRRTITLKSLWEPSKENATKM